MSKKVKRLYEQFQPRHYILELKPDRKKMTFSGTVIISGTKVGRPSHRLTFHQSGQTITSAHLTRHDKTGDHEVVLDRINHHGKFNEVRLHSKDMLFPGHYTISLNFRGKITRPMNGVYPSFFRHEGKNKKIIATQFESHHAREVFPCIDEPQAKATFDLRLTTPAGETVLSNTPILKQSKENNNFITEFETTPLMPTYLLAFVYGELGYKEIITKRGVHIRTYATPDNVKYTEFALEFAAKCLDFFSDYFDSDYPLKKCDLVALPDFAAGAMENWGCITFREQALLVDPKHTSLPTKQHIAMVIAHELAHQWFGNLVTMRWWTDLWLNEGFASWIEYLAVDEIFPDWQMWTQFIVDEQAPALRLDALKHTHPVEVPVNHPDEIRSIFDIISYGKGASVIQMLHSYLGAAAFRDGLRYYLKQNAYKNTDTIDLWSALEQVSEKPIKSFMHDWTATPGYPLVRASVNQKSVSLEQERFYINQNGSHSKKQLWPIPLLLDDSPGFPPLLNEKSAAYKVNNLSEFKLNKDQGGFYRVIYNATHRDHLGHLIERGHLGPLDRLGILSDAFEAAKAGYSDTAEALKLIEHFVNEDNSAVWDVISSGLASVRAVMDDELVREGMKPYVRKLVANQLNRLGWEPKPKESHFDKLLRPTILGMAATAEDPAVVQTCLQLFSSLGSGDKLHPDIRGVVYTTAARHGSKSTFGQLLKLHNETHSSEERVTLSAALLAFKQSSLINKALALITTDVVRLQDVGYWMAYGFGNRFAKLSMWEWVTTNWPWLENNLGNDIGFFHIPLYTARAFSDKLFIGEYREFFDHVKGPAFARPILQGLETLEWQSAWKERDLKIVRAFYKPKP